jgi:hypothetical protein
MGSGYVLHCSNCLFEQNVYLGVGMLYFSLENVVGQLHPSRRARVLDILTDHSVEKTDYWKALYRCEKCGRFYNRLYARIEYDDGKVYETRYKCPKCRRLLKEVPGDFDPTTVACPSCGESCLEVQGDILWD